MSAPALAALEAAAGEILGRALTVREADLFDKYLKILLKWQKSQRLVGRSDPEWIIRNLFVDSLLFLRVLPLDLEAILDLGSGAGFPGVPIKIVRSGIRLTMVESRRKRASFLAAVVRELGLTDTRVINARIEEAGEELAGSFDAVVVRCAGSVEELAAKVKPLLAPGGMLVASGPPAESVPRGGQPVVIAGARRGSQRRFVVYRA